MAKKPAFFMLWLNAPASKEAEWNEWLNKVHVPARLKTPGFLFAHRYTAVEGDHKYLNLYGLADADVLSSQPYRALRDEERSKGDPSASFLDLTEKIPNTYRGVYEQIFPQNKAFLGPKADVVLTVGIDVPAGKDDEFNAWYNTDHIPANLSCPGWLDAYRFMAAREEMSPGRKANGAKYIALWELENEKAVHSLEHEKSRTSPWTTWVHSWYNRRYRTIYRRIL